MSADDMQVHLMKCAPQVLGGSKRWYQRSGRQIRNDLGKIVSQAGIAETITCSQRPLFVNQLVESENERPLPVVEVLPCATRGGDSGEVGDENPESAIHF